MERNQMHPGNVSVDFAMFSKCDAAFKQELLTLVIHNLLELCKALESGVEQPDRLRMVIHKVAPTLTMIVDCGLAAIIPIMLKTDKEISYLSEEFCQYKTICCDVIKSLEHELGLHGESSNQSD